METVNVTPSTDGLVRYFRAVYEQDPSRAERLVVAAWPQVGAFAREILAGSLSLEDAFVKASERRTEARRSK